MYLYVCLFVCLGMDFYYLSMILVATVRNRTGLVASDCECLFSSIKYLRFRLKNKFFYKNKVKSTSLCQFRQSETFNCLLFLIMITPSPTIVFTFIKISTSLSRYTLKEQLGGLLNTKICKIQSQHIQYMLCH